MFVLLKSTISQETLELHKTIFPRPTSWQIAFQSDLNWLMGKSDFSFVFVPPRYRRLEDYTIEREGKYVILRKGNLPDIELEIMPMTLYLWAHYQFESFFFGPFFSVWKWRWEDRWEQKTTRIIEERED